MHMTYVDTYVNPPHTHTHIERGRVFLLESIDLVGSYTQILSSALLLTAVGPGKYT